MKNLLIVLFVLISFILNAQKGTFIDSRDNKSYKWIKIGEQTWMNENLKYNDTIFYNYDKIMNGSKPDTVQIKGICPDGWHIPSIVEWNKLLTKVGKVGASEKLKEKNGFNSLLIGRYNSDKKSVENIGSHSYYWTSNERDKTTAWSYFIYDLAPTVSKSDSDKKYGNSLRCIKD